MHEEKVLMYTVKKGVWEDKDGTVVVREDVDGVLEIGEGWGREGEKRDLVVGCWILKVWVAEGLKWEGEGGKG